MTGRLNDLVDRAREGDERAWMDLVRRFTPVVWAAAMQVRGLQHQDYEDIAATTWCRLVDALIDLRAPEALGQWLRSTAYREALSVSRARRRLATTEVELRPEIRGFLADDELDRGLLQESDNRAILLAGKGLGRSGRLLLLALIDDPDASYEDIKNRYGIAVSSIGPTRRRAFSLLRTRLLALGTMPGRVQSTEALATRRSAGV